MTIELVQDRSEQTAEASGNGIHIGTSCLATTHAFDPAQRHAEASRLAACWNACRGISVAALEQEPYIGGASFLMRKRAEEQRDELLALLREGRNDLAIAASHWNQDEDRTVADFHRERVLGLVQRVDAAIAKLTGGAA